MTVSKSSARNVVPKTRLISFTVVNVVKGSNWMITVDLRF